MKRLWHFGIRDSKKHNEISGISRISKLSEELALRGQRDGVNIF